MSSKPPVRQDPTEYSGTRDIAPEVQAQVDAQRRRATKARTARRPRMTYDLPRDIIEGVREVAKSESVCASDVVALALCEFLDRYKAGDVDLEPLKTPARSLRFAHRLALPAKWEK